MYKILLLLVLVLAAMSTFDSGGGGAEAACAPICTWDCPGLECDLATTGVTNDDLCTPVCNDPVCEFVCYNSTMDEVPCTPLTTPANCVPDYENSTGCPFSECPDVNATCDPYTCPTDSCEIVCDLLECEFNCRDPSIRECPKPICSKITCTKGCPQTNLTLPSSGAPGFSASFSMGAVTVSVLVALFV